MLVILFWIFAFIGCACIVAFIIGLFFQNMKFKKLIVITFIISLLGLVITFKSCVHKVKDDFGYQPKSEQEYNSEQQKHQNELIKTEQQLQQVKKTIDSLKQVQQVK